VSALLLAEGHGPTRDFVTGSLATAGFEVLAAGDPDSAWELFAARRPEVVVLAADLPGAEPLAQRLRAAAPRVLVVVADRAHLGKPRGLTALVPLKANAYVADPTHRELVEKVQQLVAQSAHARPAPAGLALVLSRTPAGAGEVGPGVVARLLHQLWRALQDGALVLDGGGPERRVLLRRGVPVACLSDDPAESLLGWLAEGGRVDAAQKAAALDGMASGLSPGAALIAAGVLEPGEPLHAALRAHAKALLVRALAQKEGRWRFHAGDEHLAQLQPVDLLPLPVLLEGARAGIPLKHLAEALRAVQDAYPVRTGELQQILPAAALSSADLRLALALDGRTRTRDFLDARKADLKDAISLLWFLSLVGAVAFQEAPVAADAYGAAPPPRRRPLPPERADAIRQAALRILPGTYLHALGVDLAAGDAEIEAAYRDVASRFHPDGFAEYEVGDLADLLASVQDKVSAAYRVLGNADKRRSYLSFLLVRAELGGQRRPGVDLDAEIALRRGERALRERRNAAAVSALREAVERNPREPEYAAMLAFASLHDPTLPPSARAGEARRWARKALALAPDHPRAVAAAALAEEAAGDLAEARRALLAALKVHPRSEPLRRVLQRVNRVRPPPA
jgi:DNA-binding response OmpR family regulator/tetratricopeptide (TPR) repeat protein